MGNGHCIMPHHCYLCKDVLSKSYFLRLEDIEHSYLGFIVEVCPRCHHHYKYSPEDILEQYKKRVGIKYNDI